MSYKQTLLKETKQLIKNTKADILQLVENNKLLLSDGEIKAVENNMLLIAEKENLLRQYKLDLENILCL